MTGRPRNEGGRLKGEATPSYSLLPVERIQLVRRLLPEVKLVYLMREPVARAWSHARHNHRFREANFVGCDSPLADISDSEWRANFAHDWPLAFGDYLGQLRRWLSVFPRQQFYVGFYESIARDPSALLRDVFAFLGVTTRVDFSSFHVHTKILAGQDGELRPALRQTLLGLFGQRTRELASFLRERLALECPPEWQQTLTAPIPTDTGLPAPFRHESEDYLSRVLEHEERC